MAQFLDGGVEGYDKDAPANPDDQKNQFCGPEVIDERQQQEQGAHQIGGETGAAYAIQRDQARNQGSPDDDADGHEESQVGDVGGRLCTQDFRCPGHQHDPQCRCAGPEQAQGQQNQSRPLG